MPLSLNDSGVWRSIKRLFVNDVGVWRPIKQMFINDNGTWRRVFAAEFAFSIVSQTQGGSDEFYTEFRHGYCTGIYGLGTTGSVISAGSVIGNVDGRTVLDMSSTTGDISFVQIILAGTADMDFVSLTINGHTYLKSAAIANYISGGNRIIYWSSAGAEFTLTPGATYPVVLSL